MAWNSEVVSRKEHAETPREQCTPSTMASLFTQAVLNLMRSIYACSYIYSENLKLNLPRYIHCVWPLTLLDFDRRIGFLNVECCGRLTKAGQRGPLRPCRKRTPRGAQYQRSLGSACHRPAPEASVKPGLLARKGLASGALRS